MRRILSIIALGVAAVALVNAPAHAREATSIEAVVANTVVLGPGEIPSGHTVSPLGVGWHDGAGGWHARKVPISDEILDASGALIGSMSRHVSFNVHPTSSASTAWCDFTMVLFGFGSFEGRCNGSLLAGQFRGHDDGGALLSGTYVLAPGGIPGVGPYDLDMVVTTPSPHGA